MYIFKVRKLYRYCKSFIFFILIILCFNYSFFNNNLYANDSNQLKRGISQTLTLAFFLMVDKVNSPLQSLATLFNGSGRVAADEFEKTIRFLRGYNLEIFPDSMGFITQSVSDSCMNVSECWVVAYSTDKFGVLRPGSDISRFPPLLKTVNWAVSEENQLIVGPPFHGENGKVYSYYALTVRNTRQFGVVVSIIEYDKIYKKMLKELGLDHIAINLEMKLKTKDGYTKAKKVINNQDYLSDNYYKVEEFKIHNVVYFITWNSDKLN